MSCSRAHTRRRPRVFNPQSAADTRDETSAPRLGDAVRLRLDAPGLRLAPAAADRGTNREYEEQLYRIQAVLGVAATGRYSVFQDEVDVNGSMWTAGRAVRIPLFWCISANFAAVCGGST